MAVDKQTLGAVIGIIGTGGSGGGSVGAYTFKGSVATFNDLPTLGNEVGDIYDVQATGMNYAWTGEAWDALGQRVDVSALEDEIDKKVSYAETQSLGDAQKERARGNIGAEKASEVMTMAQYEALTEAQKMDGTVRYITDVNILLPAEGVGF